MLRGVTGRSGLGAEVGTPSMGTPAWLVSFTGPPPPETDSEVVSERTVPRRCVELGANPLVVCDDADLGLAAGWRWPRRLSMRGRLRLRQPHHRLRSHDAFCDAMLRLTSAMRIGSGPDDDCGPLIGGRASIGWWRVAGGARGRAAAGRRSRCGRVASATWRRRCSTG